MNRNVVALALAVSLAGAGCGRFEHVVQHSGGGVVRIDGALVPSTSAAHLAITEHCSGPWRVIPAEVALAAYVAPPAAGKGNAESTASARGTAGDAAHIGYECVARAAR